MAWRALLVGVQAIALLSLSGCGDSHEAGTPTSSAPSSHSPPPTSTRSKQTGSPWTDHELQAITAAKHRYAVARAAAGAALADPGKATREMLEKAGNGGTWVSVVASQIAIEQENGWYQTGAAVTVSTAVQSVNLTSAQPEVRLTHCIDSTTLVTRYQSNGRPVPEGSSDGPRHRFSSKLVYALDASGTKMWFLVEENVAGTC